MFPQTLEPTQLSSLSSLSSLSGEFAAIGTAFLYAVSSTLFTLASRRVGAPTINRSRLLFASIASMTILWVSRGTPVPAAVSAPSWAWLALSGVIGLALGDELLFRAYVIIGTARSMLLFSLAPAIAASLGWVFFAESLAPMEILGITMTLGGIGWVVSAPGSHAATYLDRRAYVKGIGLALGGAMGQALGLVTAKVALEDGVPAQEANCIRLIAAAIAVWTVAAVGGRALRAVGTWAESPRATAYTLLASFLGPVAGVWLSLIAIELSSLGVAATLMSLTPLILLPIGRIVFGESVTIRALLGTTLALGGVAVLLRFAG